MDAITSTHCHNNCLRIKLAQLIQLLQAILIASCKSLMNALGQDNGVENVYVPAEAVRQYMQDGDLGWDDLDWGDDVKGQYEEAIASGGDLVIPIGTAMASIAGTPAFDALKNDMRLSAGGQSLSEAEEFAGAMADQLQQAGALADEEAYYAAQERAPRQKIFDGLVSQLTAAGYRQDVASQYALLATERAATRAVRTGKSLTGDEYANLQINQVLPAGLAAMMPRGAQEGSASLARVIVAMRGNEGGKSNGPSLTAWLRQQGGVDDAGGDLEAIGFGRVKGISKKGRTKLIRKTRADVLAAQGASLLGNDGQANTNSLDELALRAWEAGYFPEFNERPTVNDLLNALSDEQSGRQRFANDNATTPDEVRVAAQELRQLLEQEGLDPATAAEADIAAAIERYHAAADGPGFDQPLPDVIDIDGVARPTMNSEGRPLARDEAGVRAFWAWFGDSKVVDAQGRPLVVYHGTDTKFSKVNLNKGAQGLFWFSSDRAKIERGDAGAASRDIIMPLYAKLERPADWREYDRKMLFELKRDYDGAILNDSDGMFDGFILNEPTQIKSVNNRGTFDPTDARILFQSGLSDDVRSWAQGVEERLGLESFDVWLTGRGDLKLNMLIVGKDNQRSGRGTKAMEELVAFADSKGLRAVLSPALRDDHLGTTSRERLVRFYKRFGFKENKGRSKDFSVSEGMIREPQGGRSLAQSFADGPRGRVTFQTGRTVIDLFQERDLSTFIHEMGHYWLEEMFADAADPNATPELQADVETIKAWFKANGHAIKDGVIPTEAHELWARGVERYTMEGKSPSSALRKAFAAFRSWMLRLYGLVDSLKAPISPEIRGVMDRMFATDDEIAAAYAEQDLKAAFTDAAQAGMTDAEFAVYSKAVNDARDEAHDALLFKVMEEIRRRRTKEYQEARAGVADRVRGEVESRPVFRAYALLSGEQKLNRAWLKRFHGDNIVDQLPKAVPPIHAENGGNPDVIAEMAGFASGDEMIKALIGMEDRRIGMRASGDKRSVRQATIDEETDALMMERYGDPLNDGSIEEEALAAVHNERQGEVLAMELRQLSKKTRNAPSTYKIAKQWAAEKIAAGSVNEVASRGALNRYARAAAKAGREAEKAILAGDMEAAFRHKQAQMLNNALIAEASVAADAIEKALKRMGNYARKRTIKSMDQDYLEQIHALLEDVDLRPRSQVAINRQESFEKWAAAREAEGHDIVVPPSFAKTIGQTNWSRLTVEQLIGLDETVKQIAHLGRLKQTLLDGAEKREYEAVVAEARGGMKQLPPKQPKGLADPNFMDSLKSGIADFDAALLKVETVFDWLDNGNSEGVFNRIVFKPIADAQARSSDMQAKAFTDIRTAMEKIDADTLRKWQSKVVIPELFDPTTGQPVNFQRQKLVAMALNVGNEGNLQRLADGYGWNEDALLNVLNRELSAQEWQFVQDVWDVIDGFWPELSAMERRVNGVAPDKVDPRPVETPHGTFKGGYFPAVYDWTLIKDEDRVKAGSTDSIFEGGYARATTRSSSTKARADQVRRPILLNLGVINRHIGEVIHDITHREAVIQADKFLTDPRIVADIDATLGQEIRKQLRPWLKHVANQWANDADGNKGMASFMTKLRANTTAVGMGFRVSTILMQVAGYSNSFEYVGARWVVPAIAQTTQHPIESFKFVMERSGEVRHRMDTLDRDIDEGIRQAQGGIARLSEAKRFMFHGIGYMDRVVVIPTWLGAYNKALAAGQDEQVAIYEADKAVRKSQGAGAAKDLAWIQRGKGNFGQAGKLLTMFYAYMSAFYQRQRTLARDTGAALRTGNVRDFPALLARAWWLFVVPPILSELLAGRGPDDDEDWSLWAFKQMLFNVLGPIPVVRDVAKPLWAKFNDEPSFGYAFTPAAKAFDTLINSAGDLGNLIDGEETKRATRNAMEAVGYATGLVPGQIAAAAQFLVDVGYGEQDPRTAGDWWEGLTTGKTKED